ncbi:hypothetical protein [Streptomyces sp. CA-111067]|uniref:hypothetical protein n=1 Tax=Streptomyces sp. CA-111067 TaxID=3240046 RepID=UPI003D95D3DE
MNPAERPTTQDTAIVEALGRPLTVLYTQAAAGAAEPAVQRVLELRSFLALVEDQAVKTRDRIRQAADPAGDLYSVPARHLRWQTELLEQTLEVGRRYGHTLRELLGVPPADTSPSRRPVQFTQSKIATISPRDGGLTARPGPADAPVAAGAGAGRHRR